MLRSRRLLPELGTSVAGQGLVPFLDQLVLFEDTKLRSHLAWLGGQWRICRFLWYYAEVMTLWRLELKGGLSTLVIVVDGASFSPFGPGTGIVLGLLVCS
jgi:hypothetical protein